MSVTILFKEAMLRACLASLLRLLYVLKPLKKIDLYAAVVLTRCNTKLILPLVL